jgi:membrane protease YdiL (CAAX protease family)
MTSEPQKINLVNIVLFMALAIVLSALWGRFASSHGMLNSPRTAGVAAWLAQITVFIAAAFTMLIRSRTSFRQIGWRVGPFKAYAAVFAVTLAIVAAAIAIAYLMGGLDYAPQVTPMQVLVTLPILFIPSCLFGFAEEFGWRGFLLQQLGPLGPRGALNTLGALTFFYFVEKKPFIGDFAGYVGTALLVVLAAFLLIASRRLKRT